MVCHQVILACHIEGQGPELIMFHGGTGSWTHWIDVSARVDPCRELMPAIRIELIPDAGHWVQYERPEPVNRLLIEFFKQG